jgi:hypothetical protein
MALDYNTAYKTFSFIQNSQLLELRKSLYKSAIRYAVIRSEWEFQSIDERDDAARTMAHNRFIDSCNILSREQSKVGEDNNWRRAFGNDRQLIGDFACYLSCFIGIKNR